MGPAASGVDGACRMWMACVDGVRVRMCVDGVGGVWMVVSMVCDGCVWMMYDEAANETRAALRARFPCEMREKGGQFDMVK